MNAIIRTQNLSKDFGGGRGIQGVNLEVPRGTIFGFIGPNGAGKTTTIRILCGLLDADGGEAWMNDLPVLPKNSLEIKRLVGFLPDEFGVYQQMSVWEYLDFFGAAYKIPPKARKQRIEYVLEVTDASHMMDYQVASLSRGMHQKIGIAKTLLHDPLVLILDEPANGLDPYARIEMRKTILRLRELGKTIMLSSHILPELGTICDRVGIIEKGKLLIQGTVQEIVRQLRQHISLEIHVDSDIEVAARLAGEFAGIQKVTHAGAEVRAEFIGKRTELADFNAYLVQHGVRVLSLREAEMDLERVFLTVTGHQTEADTVPHRRPANPGA
jgi:ABC-2 type transport system ATP-binding protein